MLNNKWMPPCQTGSRDGADLSNQEISGVKEAAVEMYSLHHCILVDSRNVDNRGHRLCFAEHFGRLFQMVHLLFIVGFYSFKSPLFMGLFINLYWLFLILFFLLIITL